MRSYRASWILAALAVSMLLVGSVHSTEFGNHGVIHTVFLWLKKPGDEMHRRQLLRAAERLRVIPDIVDLRMGEVIESDRNIVDDSFDIGIYFYFDDVDAMNRYLLHPRHQAIVERDIKPLVQRILVHDFQHSVIR